MIWRRRSGRYFQGCGELEEDIKEVFSRRSRKEITGMVQAVVFNRKYLVRLQDGLEKDKL